jgi:hypothetical protein
MLPRLGDRHFRNHHQANDDTDCYRDSGAHGDTNADSNQDTYGYTNSNANHYTSPTEPDTYSNIGSTHTDANLDVYRDANADRYACAANAHTGQGTQA